MTWSKARQLEKKAIPHIQAIYKTIFPTGTQIKRHRDTDTDIRLHIDSTIKFKNGITMTIQEKALTTDNNTLAIEYFQDRDTKEPGELFYLYADMFFCCYWNSSQTGLKNNWHLIDVPKLKLWLARFPRPFLLQKCKPTSTSRASALYIPFNIIPDDVVLASAKKQLDTSMYDLFNNDIDWM
jgi:hypothetical protein